MESGRGVRRRSLQGLVQRLRAAFAFTSLGAAVVLVLGSVPVGQAGTKHRAFSASARSVSADAGPLKHARSTALPDGTCGLCVLAPAGTSLTDTGNGAVTVDGGNIIVDSAGTPAVKVTGNGKITAPSVGVVGTVTTTGHGTVENLTSGIQP